MKIVKSEMIKIRLELNALQSDSEISFLNMSFEKSNETIYENAETREINNFDNGPFSVQ